MNKAVFHVGFGKTGSSSLQRFLSLNPVLNGEDGIYVYCVIRGDGTVLIGDEVSAALSKSKVGYVASHPAIGDLTSFRTIRDTIKTLNSAGKTPIFSQEDWLRRVQEFKATSFFDEIDCVPDCLAFIRPQVEWFNSGWWQWWVWSEQFEKPEDVLALWSHQIVNWEVFFKAWDREIGHPISIFQHSGDIISKVLEYLCVPDEETMVKSERSNQSLSVAQTKLLWKFSGLRKPEYGHVDLVIQELFPDDTARPWSISDHLATELIRRCERNNRELADRLSGKARNAMLQDDRWWNAAYYADRTLFDPRNEPLTFAEALRLVRSSVDARLSQKL